MQRLTHMITLQKLDAQNRWQDVARYHAGVNKASGKEFLQGGSMQSQLKLVFTLRYCSTVAEMRLNTQRYRIIYRGGIYKVTDYDDFMERHKMIKVLGESYGYVR